jgi:hypothetical protein
MRCDRSAGLCCAQPANTSLGMTSLTKTARGIIQFGRQSVGKQNQCRTGLGLSLVSLFERYPKSMAGCRKCYRVR